jgi:hypothetical protein
LYFVLVAGDRAIKTGNSTVGSWMDFPAPSIASAVGLPDGLYLRRVLCRRWAKATALWSSRKLSFLDRKRLMRSAFRTVSLWLPLGMVLLALGNPSARAQTGMSGTGRSLGGYGASVIGQYYSSGMGSYMPYNGNASGFIPYRGGFAGGLGVQPVPRRLPQTPIGGVAMSMTPIGGASLSGGMNGGTRGGMGAESRRSLVPFGYEAAIGMGGMIGTPMTRQGGMRRPATGLGFGYPFSMPPDLLGTPTGMAVMAP